MCGIAGYFGTRRIDEGTIQSCLRLMKRRGPDHQGVFQEALPSGDQLYLLHSRLSIIDLDPRSNQPFERGPLRLAYNGELYNYTELKRALTGAEFRTSSDTEVLAELLLREAPLAALNRMEGMWAFAAWNSEKETLLLCRDRFGEKPLYIYRDESGTYFGSEVKFLFALLGRRLPVNENHLKRFMVNGYKALHKTPERFFRGLEEVPAASVLELRRGKPVSSLRYWTPSFQQDPAMTMQQAIQGTRDRLIRSVELRLRADVPLAFCMSGGVDSNSLLSIAKRELGYDVHGFTIMNTDARYEESDLVNHAVKELGIRHTGVVPSDHSQDFLPKLRTLIRQHDAPVYTINYFTHWLLMGEIHARGYKVSISGTSADELFTGYYDHHLFYLSSVRDDKALLDRSLGNWLAKIKPIVRNPLLQDPEVFLKNPDFRGHIYLDAEEFSACLNEPWSEAFTEQNFSQDPLRNRMANEIFVEATPIILHEDDLNAMYFSIENRSPFLDRELFEFSARIPSRHLIHNGVAKHVLRESMRGIVPDMILDNPRKVGFNSPVTDLLNDESKAFLLQDSPIFGVVRREKIEQLLRKTDFPNSESKFLFNFLNCKLFMDEFA
jgi:asparagine synthase (glutamine-hydrolysing)